MVGVKCTETDAQGSRVVHGIVYTAWTSMV